MGRTQEFRGDERVIVLECYPLETVSGFELKSTEAEGWVAQTGDYLVRRKSVVELQESLGTVHQLGGITYTGGYVLPGTVPGAGQTQLPKDLEHAAIEQVAAWFQNREKVGLTRHWPNSGTYVVLSSQPLLPAVSTLLRKYERWGC